MSTGTGLQRARTLIALERWDDAAREASQVLATDPASVEALCLLAQSQIGAGRPHEAAETAARAAALAPDEEWPLRLLAIAARDVGRFGEAERAARTAVSLVPYVAATHATLANVLIASGKPKDAVDSARMAVHLAPHDADVHTTLGLALAEAGHTREARAAYHEALRLQPDHAVALNNIAVLDLAKRRLGRAARGVAAGLRSDPRDEVLRSNLDAVGERLLHRLLNAMLLSGFLLLIVLSAEQDGAVPPIWPRMLVGLALLGAYAAIAWATLRQLPAGMRRHLRTLPLRSRARWRWVLVTLISLAMLLVAFAPADAAALGAILFVVIIRGVQLMLVFLLLRWVFRRITGVGRQ